MNAENTHYIQHMNVRAQERNDHQPYNKKMESFNSDTKELQVTNEYLRTYTDICHK